jgi:L-alanine-DL-glutamate epimerase-like enolase superfamily enzyme
MPLTRRQFLVAPVAAPLALGVFAQSRAAPAADSPSPGAAAASVAPVHPPAPPAPSAAAKSLKIARIDLFPVRYPMTGYFKFFAGPAGEAGRAAIIIKITADDGTVGWGESVPLPTWSYETLEGSLLALRHYYVPALLGRDPADFAGAHAALDHAIAPSFSTGMPIARAGLDIALHDLVGRAAGQPLHALWGRPRGEPLTLSWTVNPRTLDEIDGLVADGRQRGYRHFNIKVAPDLEFDVALAKRVRQLAPECFLWADANCGYDRDTALRAAPRLADAGVNVFEAPMRPNLLSGYQEIRRQGALPIFMDEGVVSPVELAEFIKLGMLDGVAEKPARCGGLWSCRRQIELLLENKLTFLGSGLTDPDISLAAMLALYAAYGLKKPAALNGPQFLTASVLKNPLEVVAGRLALPEGPGLGIEVDEEKVRALSARTFDPAAARL